VDEPIVVEGCQGCGACLLTCPEHAIRPRGGSLHALAELCTGCGECVEVCPADAITLREVHPIERESYRILRSTVQTSHLPRHSRAVAERIVHTTADPGWVGDLVLDEAALAQGAQALRRKAPLIVDVTMVAAGITKYDATCLLSEVDAVDGLTRSAAAFRLAARRYPRGAVWVVGNAPTALFELLRHDVDPALVIGLPVGFVGAVESKETLRRTDLPQLSNITARGGAAVAAAAVNALLYGDPLEETR
jgi:precorrin-8X/cobalt-precorrin-8 methylmutase